MHKLFSKLLAAGLFFGVSLNLVAKDCESENIEISMSQIKSIFEKMETKDKWNTKAKLMWGYFFFDTDKAKLQKLSAQLAKDGYNKVEWFFNGRNYTLHIEKAEVHTPQSLFDRDTYFATLAQQYCIKTYDGFDVGLYTKK